MKVFRQVEMNSKNAINCLKVVHIHNNTKFINGTSRFEGPFFENKIIIIGKKGNYKGIYENTALYLKPTPGNVKKIIEICNTSDLVVFYDLNNIKSYIANQLYGKTKMAWRFFGLELYGKLPQVVYSDLTQKARKKDWITFLKEISKKKIKKLGSFLKWKKSFNPEFDKAISNIDFFLGFCQEEYDLLKSYWKELPGFVQLPIAPRKKITPNPEKTNLIIVGNNRSAYNNHLDILKIIESNSNKSAHFLMPFNYGVETNYSKMVREKANKIANLELLENFLPNEKYEKVFFDAQAAIFNGFRQMAMANVIFALENGVKLYLNIKNPVYQWLKKEGFLIFSTEDFKKDLKTDQLKLTNKEARYNAEQLIRLTENYTLEDFQKKLYNAIISDSPLKT